MVKGRKVSYQSKSSDEDNNGVEISDNSSENNASDSENNASDSENNASDSENNSNDNDNGSNDGSDDSNSEDEFDEYEEAGGKIDDFSMSYDTKQSGSTYQDKSEIEEVKKQNIKIISELEETFIKQVKLNLLSPQDMVKISGGTIIEIPGHSNDPVIDALGFQAINGIELSYEKSNFEKYETMMGPIGEPCGSCRKTICNGHRGRIRLPRPIFNVAHIKTIVNILNIICLGCKDIRCSETTMREKKITNTKGSNRIKALVAERTTASCSCSGKHPDCIEGIFVDNKNNGISLEIKTEQGKTIQPYSPLEVYNIFKDISNATSRKMGFGSSSHPRCLILFYILVIPPSLRPPIQSDTQITNKMTEKYKEILHECYKFESGSTDETNLVIALTNKYKELVLGAKTKNARGDKFQPISELLTGKKAYVRGGLGKRGDFCARTVLGPNNDIRQDQISLPRAFTDHLTVPITLTHNNRFAIIKLIKDGQVVNIIKSGENGIAYKMPIGNDRDKSIDLRKVVKIERKLMDGDYISFIRQPTIHKNSQAGYEVVIAKEGDESIGLHPSNVTTHNADFDGDEGNIFSPQNFIAATELSELMAMKSCIISSQNNKPLVGLIIDSVIGAGKMTSPVEVDLPQSVYFNCLMKITQETSQLRTLNERLEKYGIPAFSGKALFSALLPENFTYSEGEVIILEGILIQGQIKSEHVGNKHRSIVQYIYKNYGYERSSAFLTDAVRLIQEFLDKKGHSVGISDCENVQEVISEVDDNDIDNINNKLKVLYDNRSMLEGTIMVFESKVTKKKQGKLNLLKRELDKTNAQISLLRTKGITVSKKSNLKEDIVYYSSEFKKFDPIKNAIKSHVTKIKLQVESVKIIKVETVEELENRNRRIIELVDSLKNIGIKISNKIMFGMKGELKNYLKIVEKITGQLKNLAKSENLSKYSKKIINLKKDKVKINERMNSVRQIIIENQEKEEKEKKEIKQIEDEYNNELHKRYMKIKKKSGKVTVKEFAAIRNPLIKGKEKFIQEVREKYKQKEVEEEDVERIDVFTKFKIQEWDKIENKEEYLKSMISMIKNIVYRMYEIAEFSKTYTMLDELLVKKVEINLIKEYFDIEKFNSFAADLIFTLKKQIPLSLTGENNIGQMISDVGYGSKGTLPNVAQILGLVGQQFYRGNILPATVLGDRLSVYHSKYDDSIESKAFILSNFRLGLTAIEFFYHLVGIREGALDTAFKVSDIGDIRRKIMQTLLDLVVEYDGSVRTITGQLVQPVYGNSGYDVSELITLKIPGNIEMSLPFDIDNIVNSLNTNTGWVNSKVEDYLYDKPREPFETVKEKVSKIKSKEIKDIEWSMERKPPIFTSYERAKVIGMRAEQLDKGSTPMVDPKELGYYITSLDVFEKEKPDMIRNYTTFMNPSKDNIKNGRYVKYNLSPAKYLGVAEKHYNTFCSDFYALSLKERIDEIKRLIRGITEGEEITLGANNFSVDERIKLNIELVVRIMVEMFKSERLREIETNPPSYVKLPDVILIAKTELKKGLIPFDVIRKYPNGIIEKVSMKEGIKKYRVENDKEILIEDE